jgi:adenosine deaminase
MNDVAVFTDDSNPAFIFDKWNVIGQQLQSFLMRIPKADLHIHLDGSIRIGTLIELAQQHNVPLPSYDADELRDLVFPETYNSLEEYLRGFAYVTKALRSHDALERVAYECAMDAYNCGVRHLEVRFAPQMHAIPGELSIEQVICSVNRGMEQAVRDADELDALSGYLRNTGDRNDSDDGDERNLGLSSLQHLDKQTIEKIQQLRDKRGMHPYHPDAPPHQYGIIACAMRFFLPDFSPYYEAFYEVHRGEDPHRVFGLASVALVTAVNNLRRKGKCCCRYDCCGCPACEECSSSGLKNGITNNDNHHHHHDHYGYILPVVALDIAGAESGYPASDHREAFDLAHQSFLHKTVHAGEGKNVYVVVIIHGIATSLLASDSFLFFIILCYQVTVQKV